MRISASHASPIPHPSGPNPRYCSPHVSTLSEDARAVLDKQVEALKTTPGLMVTLFGHSDPTEPEEIALRRAEAVRDYLAAQGISAGRLTAASRGSRAIIALKPSEEAFAAMRFVSTEPQAGQ
ncbi:MAG: OmpA family protein [Pseudomonadota bacterium]